MRDVDESDGRRVLEVLRFESVTQLSNFICGPGYIDHKRRVKVVQYGWDYFSLLQPERCQLLFARFLDFGCLLVADTKDVALYRGTGLQNLLV